MKKAMLFCVGLFPFAMGVALDAFITGCPVGLSFFFAFINLAVLALWGAAGFLLRRHAATTREAVALAHLPAAVMLLLILVQELALGHYRLNWVGLATQLFYLPLIHLPSRLLFFAHTLPPVYIAAFAGMVAVFWLGARLYEKAAAEAA